MVLRGKRACPRKAVVRRLLLAPVLAAAACAAIPPAAAPPGRAVDAGALFSETRPSMSTVVSIAVAGASVAEASSGAEAAFRIFARVDEVMNEWRPESPLSALNAAAGNGRFVDLPGDLCQVLRAGRDGAERTGGLFDPTWAALRGVWRFGDGVPPALPSSEAVAAACRLVDWRDLEIEPAGSPASDSPCRARLRRTGMQVGLGGLAKGWAVDRAVAQLRRRGLRDFLVQAGGDLYASGRRDGRPWRVGIRDPRAPAGEPFAWVDLSDAAFSTTGDSERFFVVDGRRYHHVIDTRTCRPATASRQVSVLSGSALEAEILGKAVFTLGDQEGLALAGRSGAAAVIVTSDNQVVSSAALSGRLDVIRPPSP
jgi:thiamine biosynthesis lipoprotein